MVIDGEKPTHFISIPLLRPQVWSIAPILHLEFIRTSVTICLVAKSRSTAAYSLPTHQFKEKKDVDLMKLRIQTM